MTKPYRLEWAAILMDALRISPKDFAWKVRWRMKHDRNPLFVDLLDKHKVKDYAAQRGVKTARLLYVTPDPRTIPFDALPDNYMIKANHGSGWNVLCRASELYFYGNGSYWPDSPGSPQPYRPEDYRLTRDECIRLCASWMNRKYSKREWAYRMIDPKIVVEELLISRDGGELKDYRLYAFAGVVKAINVGSPSFRRDNVNVFLNPDWQEIKLTRYKEKLPDPLPIRPDNFTSMIQAAERLGAGLDFVRVDLFDTSDGIVLGEMTVYPDAGQIGSPAYCPKFNRWLGEQWVLPDL